jgi:hypothetical protein
MADKGPKKPEVHIEEEDEFEEFEAEGAPQYVCPISAISRSLQRVAWTAAYTTLVSPMDLVCHADWDIRQDNAQDAQLWEQVGTIAAF